MTDVRFKLLVDAAIDFAALVVLGLLCYAESLNGSIAAPLIAGVAASQTVGRVLVHRAERASPRTSTSSPPSNPLGPAVALAALILGLGLAVSSCGASSGSPSTACTAVRSARAAAELAEPYVCEIDAGAR